MKSFNLALLAKQWWRIIKNVDSLCHKVLKARYFHDVQPMRAKVGSNPSFLWKSLLEGRKVIERVMIWIVGDGNSIDVWQDPWLKMNQGFKANLIDHNMPTPLKVASLIDSSNRSWISNKVNEIFTEEDAGFINSIHLSRSNSPDRLI